VQRFRCTACGRNFSSQTFSVSYWQKRPDLSYRLLLCVSGCMGNRQAARKLHASPESIGRHIARLGRHCLLFHLEQWAHRPPQGPVVLDGLRSFEFSQYRPFEHQVLVEADTDFWIYHIDSELRRSGSMTAAQKRRRAVLEAQHGKPAKGSLRAELVELIQTGTAGAKTLCLRSDDHSEYPRALRAVKGEVAHEVTSSRQARTAQNPLFPVNLLELLIRHSQSNHKRETIAFSKRRQASAERLLILQVWRNYIKARREKRPGVTPAMLRGLAARPLGVEEILSRRRFPGHYELGARWAAYYRRQIKTREIAHNREHCLKYAF
jgi:hypothetical protein